MKLKKAIYPISNKCRSLILCGTLTCCATLSGTTIKSLKSTDNSGYMTRAKLMMADGNFMGAIDQLRQVQLNSTDKEMLRQSEYLLAIAYYERGDDKCIDLLKKYVATYPSSVETLNAKLTIGDFYFFDKQFGKALTAYEKINLSSIDSEQRATYKYRKALSLTKIGRFDEARQIFSELTSDDEYSHAAHFYLAYLDYVEGDYDKALEGFQALSSPASDRVSRSMPRNKADYQPTGLEAGYYITQIEFHQGRYDDVIAHGSSLLQKMPIPEFIPETNRIIGESHFKIGNESLAKDYLSKYFANDESTPTQSAIYTMGVILYNESDYSGAEEYFTKIIDEPTALNQSASLYRGQCAMHRNDLTSAAILFEKAYQMNYDYNVSETALYNYVVAITQGGQVPFGSSIDILESFIANYPSSKFAPEVDEYLAAAYYNEKNYSKALKSINRIARPSDNILRAKQKVYYELGIESLSNGGYSDAADYMMQAASMKSYDKQLATQALLWAGDAYYNNGQYDKAEEAYSDFLNSASHSEMNRGLASYNLGYAQYMQDKFGKARLSLEKSLNLLPDKLSSDATLRIADCLYYTGKPENALAKYAEAINQGCQSVDYAAFQHANMQGMLGRNKQKIDELNEMMHKYPQSLWLPSAMLEKAQTYLDMGKSSDAISVYQALASTYPLSSEARKGILQMAITHANDGNTKEAIESYREVIKRWPSSQESHAANADLRRIYAAKGQLAEYRQFLSSIPEAPQLDDNQMEQLSYEAAETALSDNADNLALMLQYVKDYPNGTYLAEALYNIATSLYSAGDYNGALEYLDTIITRRSDTPYALDALSLKGEILENHLLSDPAQITAIYKELEKRGDQQYMITACLGVMRNTSSAAEEAEYANRLLNLNGISTEEKEEALLHRASANITLNRLPEAEKDLVELTGNFKSENGAKATVMLAELYIQGNKLKEAQQLLTDFTDQGTPHQYWLARGFIALADVYRAQGRKSDAIEYITSLKANYPGDEIDIQDMINQRLNNWK